MSVSRSAVIRGVILRTWERANSPTARQPGRQLTDTVSTIPSEKTALLTNEKKTKQKDTTKNTASSPFNNLSTSVSRSVSVCVCVYERECVYCFEMLVIIVMCVDQSLNLLVD